MGGSCRREARVSCHFIFLWVKNGFSCNLSADQYNSKFAVAGVAQPVEHLICNQRVGGSNPFASSRKAVESGATAGQVTIDKGRSVDLGRELPP